MVPGETAWATLLGRKVSVRYFSRADGQPSEAIGAVMSVSVDPDGHETVTIMSRRGHQRVVRVADITAGKIWPTR